MNIKKLITTGIMAMAAMCATADPVVTDVVAKQRYPWNGKVDITYTLTGDVTAGLPAWNMPFLSVTASNRVDGTTYAAAASALSGDTGTAEGAHHVVWNMDAQGLKIKSDEVVFTVTYVEKPKPYCVIDFSGGASASSYPVTYVASVPSGGFNTDEYKTTKLVLRLIVPGTFMMGGSYSTTLTKPFYCGVFEVTQKQYELVTGGNPSSYKGDMRPVEQVSWNAIRGNSSTYNWPASANVDSNSFVGRLQTRTGLNFDLPTEAQWEYACRAGTTSTYNNGGDTENDLRELGRYYGNRSDGKGGYTDAHTKVGSYEPNAWGRYDMHGNVWEWGLDWYGDLSSGVTNPVGSSSGSYRVVRGGSWGSNAGRCTSSGRSNYGPSYESSSFGFRLVRTLSNTEGERSPEAVAGAERADALCAAEAAPVATDSRMDVEPALDSVVVAWDASWIGGDAGATVVIADNGAEVKRATGEGEFTLPGIGRHELTYITYIDGVAQDEVYTATVYGRWKYEVVDGGAVITETTQTSGAVTIPAEIDGYPVRDIADGLFNGCTGVRNVTIPDSVTSIGERAFYNCSGLTSVMIPNSVTSIGEWAFRDCSGIKSVTVPQYVLDRHLSIFSSYQSITNVAYSGVITNISASAFSGCSGLTSVTIPDSVTNIGERAFYNCSGLASVTIGNSVTSIGEWAFRDCSGLTGVTLPGDLLSDVGSVADLFPDSCTTIQSLTLTGKAIEISDHAFAGCEALKTISFPDDVVDFGDNDLRWLAETKVADGLYIQDGWVMGYVGQAPYELAIPAGVVGIAPYALSEQYDLEKVMLPASLKYIGVKAFAGDTVLEDIVFPDSVVTIGDRAFEGCSYLADVTFGRGLKKLGTGAFSGCSRIGGVALPGAMEEIGINVFAGVSSLTNVIIPAHLRTPGEIFPDCIGMITTVVVTEGSPAIRAEMFKGMAQLTEIVVPGSVTNIGAAAFYGCLGLTQVDLSSSSVVRLGSEAFRGCSQLNHVDLPSALENVGASAFYGCDSLGIVVLPSSVTNVASAAFYGCSGLTQVYLSSSAVERLGGEAFRGCSQLKYVDMPPTLADVGASAFYGCSSLMSVALPGGVTNIGAHAFASCSALEQVSIGPKVEVIGEGAFRNCSQLRTVALPDGVTVLNQNVFNGCESLFSIRLPDGLERIRSCSLAGTRIEDLVVPADVTIMEDNIFGNGEVESCRVTKVYYLGNAPECSESLYSSTPDNLTSYALKRSRGWDGNPSSRAKPSTWKGRALVEVDESALTRYAVSFNANGGAFDDCEGRTIATRNVTETKGVKYVFPSDIPQRAGFEFAGWFTAASGGNEVTAATAVEKSAAHTLYAQWKYATRLDPGDGMLPEGADLFMNGDEAKMLPEPVEEEARFFAGWYAGETRVTTVAELLAAGGRATARWEMRAYTVRFDANGGAGTMADQEFAYDEERALAACAFMRAGYSFAGWSTNSSGTVDFDNMAYARRLTFEHGGVVAMKAVWTPHIYWVEFGANGGTGSMDAQSFTYGEAQKLRANAFTRQSYLFAGWALSAGGGVAYADEEEVENLTVESRGRVTLYAVWRPQMSLSGTTVDVAGNTEFTISGYFPSDYAKVTTVRIDAGTTALPDGFFAGCTALTTVEMSSELRATLGYDDLWPKAQAAARYDANGFLIFDGWVLGCRDDAATSLALPAGVKGIAAGALAYRPDLASVTLPSSLKYIGVGAFRNDTLLDDLTLPDAVTLVAADAFAYCTYLQNLTFGNGVRTIGDRAFWGCTELARLTVPASLETIGEAAFSNCWRMQSVYLPITTREVDATAFKGCSSLAGVTTPTGVAPMSDWFSPVYRQIRNVTVPKGEKNVCDGMFSGCSSLVTVELPEGITNIAGAAFSGCSALGSMTLPDTVAVVGKGAFRDCTALKNLTLPAAMRTVGDYAFKGCKKLVTVIVPKSVVSLGVGAFEGCSSLRDITLFRNLTSLPD